MWGSFLRLIYRNLVTGAADCSLDNGGRGGLKNCSCSSVSSVEEEAVVPAILFVSYEDINLQELVTFFQKKGASLYSWYGWKLHAFNQMLFKQRWYICWDYFQWWINTPIIHPGEHEWRNMWPSAAVWLSDVVLICGNGTEEHQALSLN